MWSRQIRTRRIPTHQTDKLVKSQLVEQTNLQIHTSKIANYNLTWPNQCPHVSPFLTLRGMVPPSWPCGACSPFLTRRGNSMSSSILWVMIQWVCSFDELGFDKLVHSTSWIQQVGIWRVGIRQVIIFPIIIPSKYDKMLQLRHLAEKQRVAASNPSTLKQPLTLGCHNKFKNSQKCLKVYNKYWKKLGLHILML